MNDILLLDGALGTMLQQRGLRPGELPDLMNLHAPEIVMGIHREYFEAGSNMVMTNTFSSSDKKLAGTGHTARETITRGVEIAKEAAKDFNGLVALDIGSLGELLAPSGTLSFDDAYELFKTQVIAGTQAGADAIQIETMTDLLETKCALLAAKENSHLPVHCTMSFEMNKRTFMGVPLSAMALTLDGLGADAIGLNCSVGPAEMFEMAKELRGWTGLPLIIKPNAGLPALVDGKTVFDITEDEFAYHMERLLDIGVSIIGGCCGTTPGFIRRLAEIIKRRNARVRDNGGGALRIRSGSTRLSAEDAVRFENGKSSAEVAAVCSGTAAVVSDRTRVIGERINPTGKKRFQAALVKGDMDYIKEQAVAQVQAGADILDVNVGFPQIDEKKSMVEAVMNIQSVVNVPLQIDSSNPDVIEAALRIYNGKPIINSVNGEDESLKRILPLAKKYGAAIVGLTLDGAGIPKTAEGRLAIAEKIVAVALELGIPRRDIIIDCLTLTAGAEQESAYAAIEAVKLVKEKLNVKTVLGVSNISFGLPARDKLNPVFLTLALGAGLDYAIINPNAEEMMDAVCCFHQLKNIDKGSMDYIKRFAGDGNGEERGGKTAAKSTAGISGGNKSVGEASGGAKTDGGNSGGSKSGTGKSAGENSSGTESAIEDTGGAKSAAESAPKNNSGGKKSPPAHDLSYYINNGLQDEIKPFITEMLKSGDGLSIVKEFLIPALDTVGKNYETGRIYLPQLLRSAEAAKAAFEVIKKSLQNSGQGSGGAADKILIATVKGDIHDIGKNIVKVVLENYGYDVIDLGRDVAGELIVDEIIKHDIKLVGLSALMTTTVESMEKTIQAIRATGRAVKIMAGGAVLTKDLAEKIGADYYSPDAMSAVAIARETFQPNGL